MAMSGAATCSRGRGKIAAFLDPAIYYADPEIELAFIKLLNTFDIGFFLAL